MADALFEDPRLAACYDLLEGDRPDLDAYTAIVAEYRAESVLDIGCGTGTLACTLAEQGVEVTGLDPARASLDIARRKPFADRVRWILGDVTALPRRQVHLVTMTGNVAQVFLDEASWSAVLRSAHGGLVDGGRLVFEVRDPAARAWRAWTRERTYRRVERPAGGAIEAWTEVVDERPPFVSFRQTFVFDDRTVLFSASTLRYRDEQEVRASLATAGFEVEEVRDAPDRPGAELVFVARRR